MKISIVTISYNQAQFLEQAIYSVVTQDHENLEYILVDPGSTDESRQIIARYRSKITKILYEPDDGPADGLNKGFSYATGEILGFINADDALLPGTLRKVSAYFERNPDTDVICGSGFVINGENRIIKRLTPTKFSKKLYVYGAVTFLQQSTFFRRKAFLETNGFNRDNRTCWDGELLLDMAIMEKSFDILNEDLAVFRIHQSSISGSGTLRNLFQNDCNRLFRKTIGRDMVFADKVLAALYRLEKLVSKPKVYFKRLSRIQES